jgi:hypothetical protein
MALNNENGNGAVKLGRPANADLSAKQYLFVKIVTGSKVDVCSAATDVPCGVLVDKPKSGDTSQVQVTGLGKVKAGGTIAAGDLLGTDANGAAVKLTVGTDTTKYVVAQALEAAVTGDYFEILLNALTPHRAA